MSSLSKNLHWIVQWVPEKFHIYDKNQFLKKTLRSQPTKNQLRLSPNNSLFDTRIFCIWTAKNWKMIWWKEISFVFVKIDNLWVFFGVEQLKRNSIREAFIMLDIYVFFIFESATICMIKFVEVRFRFPYNFFTVVYCITQEVYFCCFAVYVKKFLVVSLFLCWQFVCWDNLHIWVGGLLLVFILFPSFHL